MKRRLLLSTVPAALLAACTTSTTNGVTMITLNVATVALWGKAIASAAALIAPLAGPAGVAIGVIATAANADLTAFNAATNGQVTLTFNSNSVPAAVQSLLTDGQKLLSSAGNITATGAVQQYITAAQTIVGLFQGAIGVALAAAPLNGMTETQALAILKVTPK